MIDMIWTHFLTGVPIADIFIIQSVHAATGLLKTNIYILMTIYRRCALTRDCIIIDSSILVILPYGQQDDTTRKRDSFIKFQEREVDWGIITRGTIFYVEIIDA